MDVFGQVQLILAAVIFELSLVQPRNETEDQGTNNATEIYRRLYYGAFLVGEHIGFVERMILFTTLRKEDFKNYWKDENPEIQERNFQVLEKFDDVIEERVTYFLNRSKSVIEKCFSATSFNDEVDPETVKEISEVRNENTIDARRFFLQEIPARIYKIIRELEALSTTTPKTDPPTTTEKVTTTTSKTASPFRSLDIW